MYGIAGADGSFQCTRGHMANHCQQVPVVCFPEGDELVAVQRLIVAVPVPRILLITDGGSRLELSSHKTMMVVGGAIYKMTDDLLLTPFAGSRLVGQYLSIYSVQQCRNGIAEELPAVKYGLQRQGAGHRAMKITGQR